MRLTKLNRSDRGMNLLEFVVVIACVTVLVMLLLPMLATSHSVRHAPRISCINNLKQIGLAYRVWAEDNSDQYPMLATNCPVGSTKSMRAGVPDSQLVLWNFMIMSNELSTPKILHCPADRNTTMAGNFTNGLSRTNISYFAGLDASEDHPQMILSGDDNLLINGAPIKSGRLDIPTNAAVSWSNDRHPGGGNIGLADGSAQQVNDQELQETLQNSLSGSTNTFNRFAIP